MVDPKLVEFAETPRQRELLDAAIKHGIRAAARQLKVDRRTLQRTIARVAELASRRGHAPEFNYTTPVPAEFQVKGVSQLVNAEGQVVQQWVKSVAKPADTALRTALEDFAENFAGWGKPTKQPAASTTNDLMVVIPMGDPHFGMFSWGEETGQDFDLAIAERLMRDAVDKLVELTPPCETCLIINLGDFFHTDTTENRTRRSGHALDVDTRQPKILRVGIAAYVYAVEAALRRHGRVIADTRIGNHDDTSSLMLALVLSAWFRDNPRVEVVVPNGMFWYHRHGKCLLGSTHGHTVKPDQLPGVMATDVADLWGQTEFRHWYTGHVHHASVKEYPGCTVETFRTLAPADSWAHGQGYRSGRDMRADLWHAKYGMVQRFIVGVRSLETYGTVQSGDANPPPTHGRRPRATKVARGTKKASRS